MKFVALKPNHKFLRIICGLNGLFLNNFTYLCLYAFQKTFRVMTTSNPHRHIKKRLIKTVGAHTPCSCGYIQGGEPYFHIKDYQGNVRVVLNQTNRPVEVNNYYPYGGLMAATTTEGSQPYKYGTKELDRENGLDWYDSKARMYDPTIGRTPTQDPMAEIYNRWRKTWLAYIFTFGQFEKIWENIRT